MRLTLLLLVFFRGTLLLLVKEYDFTWYENVIWEDTFPIQSYVVHPKHFY